MTTTQHTDTPSQYEYPLAWVPTKAPAAGEEVTGVIVEQGEIPGMYGDYPIVTVRLEQPVTLTVGRKVDGRFTTWAADCAAGDLITVHVKGTALLHQWVELRPKDGERYRVTYRGMTPNAKGEPTHRYKSACPDRPSSVNFDKYAKRLGLDAPDVEPSGYGRPPVSDIPDIQHEFPPAPNDDDISF